MRIKKGKDCLYLYSAIIFSLVIMFEIILLVDMHFTREQLLQVMRSMTIVKMVWYITLQQYTPPRWSEHQWQSTALWNYGIIWNKLWSECTVYFSSYTNLLNRILLVIIPQFDFSSYSPQMDPLCHNQLLTDIKMYANSISKKNLNLKK